MKEITYFYLEGCPFCKKADRIIEELAAQEPRYREIKITKIEERAQRALAKDFDYYFVPALWLGSPEANPRRKLHEGVPTREKLKTALDAALERE